MEATKELLGELLLRLEGVPAKNWYPSLISAGI
jgi:hypothetical protein